jgi:hypothetical protein
MPVTTLDLGTVEGYNDAGDVGFTDPFPTMDLTQQIYRNLVETRICALANAARIQDVGVPTWNDVLFGYRSVYAKARSLGTIAPHLLAAFSGSSLAGYANKNSYGAAAATTFTDVTGKTVTSASAVTTPAGLIGNAAAASTLTIPLAAGTLKNYCVGGLVPFGDPAVPNTNYIYAKRTDANNGIRVSRQSATNVRLERNVAGTPATEADITVPTTEQVSGSAIFLRLNQDDTYGVFMNGVRIGTGTLNAAAIALTGLLVGADITGLKVIGEFECWSLAPPYQSK